MGKVPAHRKNKDNRLSIFLVSLVVVTILGVVTVRGREIQNKIDTYEAKAAEYQAKIDEEEARATEIEEFSKEVQTDGYKEEIAGDKLGLVHEDEILIKEGD